MKIAAKFSYSRISLSYSAFPGAWLYAVMMPNLGLYLLYRIAPLLELDFGRTHASDTASRQSFDSPDVRLAY